MSKLVRLVCAILVLHIGFVAFGQETRPAVQVRQEGESWTISGKTRTITFHRPDFAVTIKSPAATWSMEPSAKDDLTIVLDKATFVLPLTLAKKIDVSAWQTGFQSGLRIELSGFDGAGRELDLSLRLFICLEQNTEDVIFEIVPGERRAVVRQCLWPKGFEPASIDNTVVPFMQGMLLPRTWPTRVRLYDAISYGRGLYMPWWGAQKGGNSAMLILETPEDGGCRFDHPAGGPTSIQTRWVHSLGRLAYPRRARMCFVDNGNYVDMAKRYRRYLIEAGKFVSLREKIARSPLVGKLIGAPVIHTSILSHIQPQSSYYNKKDPAANHRLVTFDARAEHLRQLAAKGIDRAYVHLDGWGLRGYDNLHPDILPPCPEAGGWEGMRRFADTCDQLGYIFAVHDQYRDYYHDAASYSEKLTIIEENGQRPFGNTWFGGNQSILCSRFAPGHVAKNHREILAHGVKLRGAYLDVFAVVPPDECYSPDHPVTRAQCLAYRAECFGIIRALEGVVSSEEPADWAMPFIDLVHHGPFALDPGPGGGPAAGIPIPLHNLVYHGSLVVPWSLGRGGWGIPRGDLGFLYGMANAGIPYLSLNPDEKHLAQVREMCRLNQRVGLLEMTRHEFLDDTFRRQRTTFADGTTVTIDLAKDSVEVVPPLAPGR